MKIQMQTQKVASSVNAFSSNKQSPSYALKENIADSVSFGASSNSSRRVKAGILGLIAALGITAGATTAKAAAVEPKTDITGSHITIGGEDDDSDGQYVVVKRDDQRRILKKVDELTGNAKYYTYFDSSNYYTVQYVRPDNIRYLLELYNLTTKQFIANDRCNHPSQWEKVYTGPTYDEPKPPVSIPAGAETDWNSTQFYIDLQDSTGVNLEDYTIVDDNTLRVISKESKNPREDAKFITVDENKNIAKEESFDEYFNRVLDLDEETSTWGAYQFIKNVEYDRQETGFNPGDKEYSVVDDHTVKAVTSGVNPENQFVEYLVVDEAGVVLYLYAIPPAPIPTPAP